MRVRSLLFLLVGSAMVACSACNGGRASDHAPIIMGNPHTIVTDTNSGNLHDMVTDLQPHTNPVPEAHDTAATQQVKPDTQAPATKPAEAPKPALAGGNGLNVGFKEVSVAIPNIVTKPARPQNPMHSNGATYQIISGNLNGNTMQVTGNVLKVSQRYQTMVVFKNSLATLPLEAMTTTTSWQPLQGSKTAYTISGLEPAKLAYVNATPAAIRNAVIREARRHRIDRKKEQELVKSLRNIRAANERPLVVVLRSIEWKIEGKDGHTTFQKQLRLDLPAPM